MIKKIFQVIRVIFTYAKIETLIKLIYCIIIALTTPMILFSTQKFIDNISISVLEGKRINADIIFWLCVLLISMVLATSLSVIDSIINIRFQKKLNEKFSMDILKKFCRIDYRCYEDSRYNDVLMRMGDRPQERILNVFNDVINVFSLCVTVCSLIVLFIQISPIISILYFVIITVMLILDFKSMNMMNQMFNNQSFSERELNYYRDLLSDKHVLFELKIFGSLSYVSNLCRKKNSEVLKERLGTTIKSQKYFALSSVCIVIWVALIIFSLVEAILNKSISLGAFVSLVGSAGTVLSTTEALSFKLSNVAQKCYEIGYYDEFMKMKDASYGNENFCDNGKGIIEFKNVYFKYTEDSDYVLKNINMTIDLDKSTALVGENGSGKSTIVKLICRLYKPDSGSIYVNGKDIYEYSEQEYHKIINVVFQDFVKYSLTIRENVAIGNIEKECDDEVIKYILKDIVGLEGYNDLDIPLGKIEENGIDLSGGEWQKIAIARACMGNSKLIIMDEPTASLDPIAESKLYTAFMEVMSKSGSLVISHRMASAKLADIIYVIHNGQIEESGCHDKLMKKNGIYRQMYEAQSLWYEN